VCFPIVRKVTNLRLGKDHLSSLLFNLVADVLTRMLAKVSKENIVPGLLGQFRQGGILALQYADDTLLFSSCESRVVRNLKCVLMLFEQVSGMRINLDKSECIPLKVEDSIVHEITHIMKCLVGSLPFRYLGVPLHSKKLKREDPQPVIDKVIKQIAG
jgi:hypothetical protein